MWVYWCICFLLAVCKCPHKVTNQCAMRSDRMNELDVCLCIVYIHISYHIYYIYASPRVTRNGKWIVDCIIVWNTMRDWQTTTTAAATAKIGNKFCWPTQSILHFRICWLPHFGTLRPGTYECVYVCVWQFGMCHGVWHVCMRVSNAHTKQYRINCDSQIIRALYTVCVIVNSIVNNARNAITTKYRNSTWKNICSQWHIQCQICM